MAELKKHRRPLLLRPIVLLYGAVVGSIGRAFLLALRFSCRISFEGRRPEGPAIYAFWHDQLILYFMVFHKRQGHQVWMNHPAWYMKPVHFVMLRFMKVDRLALGSRGDEGRAALEEVVAALRNGASTCISPDGPHGPRRQLKPGVLLMSRASKAPIVAITFDVSRSFSIPTWDRKVFPWPFARIRVRFHEPIKIDRATDKEQAMREITSRLSA